MLSRVFLAETKLQLHLSLFVFFYKYIIRIVNFYLPFEFCLMWLLNLFRLLRFRFSHRHFSILSDILLNLTWLDRLLIMCLVYLQVRLLLFVLHYFYDVTLLGFFNIQESQWLRKVSTMANIHIMSIYFHSLVLSELV